MVVVSIFKKCLGAGRLLIKRGLGPLPRRPRSHPDTPALECQLGGARPGLGLAGQNRIREALRRGRASLGRGFARGGWGRPGGERDPGGVAGGPGGRLGRTRKAQKGRDR